MTHLSIGQLAKHSGLAVDTLRYYEKLGLLEEPERGENHYRYYAEDTLARLSFIQQAKSVGFSLKEILELLRLRLQPANHTCREVKDYTTAKLKLIDEKIEQLTVIRRALASITERCAGSEDSAERCLILQALENTRT